MSTCKTSWELVGSLFGCCINCQVRIPLLLCLFDHNLSIFMTAKLRQSILVYLSNIQCSEVSQHRRDKPSAQAPARRCVECLGGKTACKFILWMEWHVFIDVLDFKMTFQNSYYLWLLCLWTWLAAAFSLILGILFCFTQKILQFRGGCRL